MRAFVQPPGMVYVDICAQSGMLPNAYCPHRRRELFIAGREPKDVCTMHRLVRVDRHSGELATEDTPLPYIVERLAIVLSPEASEWAQEQESISGTQFMIAASLEPGGSTPATQPRVILANPEPNATFRLVPNMPIANQRIEVRAVPLAPDDLTQVKLFVDDRLLAALDEPPYTALWQLASGRHCFYAEATDRSGQSWSSPVIHITVVQ